jgi:hypothetical protein
VDVQRGEDACYRGEDDLEGCGDGVTGPQVGHAGRADRADRDSEAAP